MNNRDFDQQHIWHPYTSLTHPLPTYEVTRADGVYLQLADGRRLVDGMSSWWACLHGYNVPELNAAVEAQLKKMLEDHNRWTGSKRARELLDHWAASRAKFVKVFPTEYKRALSEINERKVLEEPATPAVAAIKKEVTPAK